MAAELFMMTRSSPFPLLPSCPVLLSSSHTFASPVSQFWGLRLDHSCSSSHLFTNKVKDQLNTYLICSHFRFTSLKFSNIHKFYLFHSSNTLNSIKSRRNTCKGKMVITCNYPQNADLPRQYSKREKKPFPVPVLELRRRARERLKSLKGKKVQSFPPRNGLLVKKLIPVAYGVINARVTLINCLKKLMRVVPVQACKYCNEIHVGPTGHPFRTCRGARASYRNGMHDWTRTYSTEDIFPPMECFHLADRLGPRIPHHERFSTPRVPALVELCIQAGVDAPGLPTKRRRKPVIRLGRKEILDANEDDLPDLQPNENKIPLLEIIPDEEITDLPLPAEDEIVELAEETMKAWEVVRSGAERLMKKYAVRVCGYCPELHVGPTGHKAQNCGAHKHQQRNGQHGWQAAVIEDLVPGRYVWHVPEGEGELQRELKSFYGQAPAVVEICVQTGTGVEVPEKYRATMRLDVGIPESLKEAEMVV